MAARRTTAVGTQAKTRRVARTMAPDQLQPGTVGMQLAEVPTEDQTDSERQSSDSAIETRREFLRVARERWNLSADSESELRTHMLEDMEFYNSEQWPDTTLKSRTLDNRVCLTINRLPQFVRQVVNQARQSKPAIQVNPVDNGADPDTAEVFQGIMRNIEAQSKAHIAYSTASEHQAIMGRGWWRILTEYARYDSMEQEIRIKRIADAFTVYPDPAASEPDHSDGIFCFIVERVPKSVYDARYRTGPGKTAVSATEFQSIGDSIADWCSTAGVLVLEYFYIEMTPITIADCMTKDKDGNPARVTLDKAMIKPELLKPSADGLPPAIVILKERRSIRKQVKWAKISGCEVLEGNADLTAGKDLPGSYIPVVPVIGEELIVNGVRNLRGMVRDAQSPQRAYNFWISSITEKIALGTKAPVIAAAGQLEGHEMKWRTSNTRNYPYLEYNPVELNGALVPAPQRAGYDPDISAALQMTMQADRDLKSVVGMFDASQEGSPEQSGKAILARQKQGEEGTSHFLDNLSRSIEHTGRILLEWIPVYYDVPRMLRIHGLDEQPKNVVVHAGQGEAAEAYVSVPMGANGKMLRDDIMQQRPFDLAVGRFDVTISVGPSYASRRQESVDSIVQLVQAYPNLLPVVGDVLMENMDWPGARQLAQRLKRMVPPDVQDPEEGQPEIPPQVKQEMADLQTHLQAAMAALQEKDDIIRTKAQEMASKGQIAKMELDAKERMTLMEQRFELAKLEAEIRSDKALALLKSQMDEIGQRLEHAHEEKMAAMTPGERPQHPSETINYKDTPPDVQRQLEAQAGLQPSTLPPPKPAPAKPAGPPAR